MKTGGLFRSGTTVKKLTFSERRAANLTDHTNITSFDRGQQEASCVSRWIINVHFRTSSSGELYLTPKAHSGNVATTQGGHGMLLWTPGGHCCVCSSAFTYLRTTNSRSDTRAVQRSLSHVRQGSLIYMQSRCS